MKSKLEFQSLISVVVPFLNEEDNVDLMYSALSEELLSSTYEIIFIDDGSSDNTWGRIMGCIHFDKKVKGIKLSRCFGHQNALKAGIDIAKGDCVITIDGDLQQPPHVINNLIQKWKEGYKIVNAERVSNSNQGIIKGILSQFFYLIYKYLNKSQTLNWNVSDFRLMDRQVVNILKEISGQNLFIRGTIQWMGFRQSYVKYQLQKRAFGQSKFTLKKMLELASIGLTSGGITPLRLSLFMGFIFAFFAFIYCLYALYATIFLKSVMPGWASVIASILLLSGVQLIVLGIIGEYIGKLFIQSKKHPSYIIDEISKDSSELVKDKYLVNPYNNKNKNE
ncbi:glycosyltransferase family 2 protein [Danxiaibacter flavus]|uniref:Glycosyltransferase family 2 protein n=1 Tax=Danxiaibacter flavus TaxID=3049108 RepID=A0ABV3ZDM5_9BACT|nr:glycosyltransferase family 2 protein [Chitinophagaceae bacterium DXS]